MWICFYFGVTKSVNPSNFKRKSDLLRIVDFNDKLNNMFVYILIINRCFNRRILKAEARKMLLIPKKKNCLIVVQTQPAFLSWEEEISICIS